MRTQNISNLKIEKDKKKNKLKINNDFMIYSKVAK